MIKNPVQIHDRVLTEDWYAIIQQEFLQVCNNSARVLTGMQ